MRTSRRKGALAVVVAALAGTTALGLAAAPSSATSAVARGASHSVAHQRGHQAVRRATPQDASAGTTATLPAVPPGSIRITQANLLSGQPVPQFQADVATVLAGSPDFITYNEVRDRNDAVLAPAPYQIWRTPGEYTGEAPVAWNTTKWTAINQGTTQISNVPGREKGQSVDWGIRYANWVTLQGVDGHVISIIATHVAPINSYTQGIVTPSINNLGQLAASLGSSGPVLMAGDMNFDYNNPNVYPRALLAQWGFTPTFDVLGGGLPTGDHHGATIDYVFMHNAAQFVAQGQYTQVLNSDHNSLTADFAFTSTPVDAPVTFAPGVVTSNPQAGKAGKRAVLDLMEKVIANTAKGSSIHLATASLNDKSISRALGKAVRRGVKVQLVTLDTRPSQREKHLLGVLKDQPHRKQFGVMCAGACVTAYNRHHTPQARLLVSQAGGTPAIRIDSSQPLTWAATSGVAHATVQTSKSSYDQAFTKFFRLVGRKV